jgi:hypothetical protein
MTGTSRGCSLAMRRRRESLSRASHADRAPSVGALGRRVLVYSGSTNSPGPTRSCLVVLNGERDVEDTARWLVTRAAQSGTDAADALQRGRCRRRSTAWY